MSVTNASVLVPPALDNSARANAFPGTVKLIARIIVKALWLGHKQRAMK
jgi:hypothetical protein